MKPQPTAFIFSSYSVVPEEKKALFSYEIEFSNQPKLSFTETIVFPEEFVLENIPQDLLKNVLTSAHIMLGISYYKLYCPSKIVLSAPISKEEAGFWNIVYRKGLGEFFYNNKIKSKDLIAFPYDAAIAKKAHSLAHIKEKMLVGIGGGKDSIVVGELLKTHGKDITALLVETEKDSPISDAVVKVMSVPSLKVKRYLDPQIFESHEGSYNGHVPISGVFAFLGYLAAVLYGYSHVVVGNEFSSNFGNIEYEGEEINHQWSKSIEFETLFQEYSRRFLSPQVTYFSLLRPFYEIRIAEMFSQYPQYFPFFSSCNRSFKVHKERSQSLWCGECAKCTFVFTLLSAFLSEKDLLGIFGKNLYENEALLPMFEDVMGFGKMKPFDCVGVFSESQAALFIASKKYSNTAIVKAILPKIANPELLAKEVFKTNPAPTVPAEYSFIGMKNVLILGYGKEGKVTEQYVQKYFPDLKVSIGDKSSNPDYLEMQKDFDIVVKTPGIPKSLIHSHYITATNLFFSQVRNTVIGVTGTKGKSTTASLIYSFLKEGGLPVRLMGNIGAPMLDALMHPIDEKELFVLELSSYQLDDLRYSPHISVVLNLFPEHMNYHGGEEAYYDAKKNIIKYQKAEDYFIYNNKSALVKEWVKATPAHSVPFDREFDVETVECSLRGEHNKENMRAAVAVAKLFDVSESAIRVALEKFKPLPHRLEHIGNFRGISFYDDAISTTPESTIMALRAIPNVATIFLGGEDRGYDFSDLEKEIKNLKIKNVVLFPESGKRIFAEKDGLNILETRSMEEAVRFAFEVTPPGSVCLLSAASPSYSLWKNFEEKGDQFKYWVEKLS